MRRKRNIKREHAPDTVYGSIAMGRFINYLMMGGKKSVAERIMYDALDAIKTKTQAKEKPLAVFERALESVSPALEVQTKRIGGANYQVPREVRPERRFFLACKWIIEAANGKKGKPMHQKLADELIAASKGEGDAIRKKHTMHRMAEANRAFAHFAGRRT